MDQQVLEDLGYKQKLDEVDQAILANAEFLDQIVANPEIFGHEVEVEEGEDTDETNTQVSEQDESPGMPE